MMLIFLALVLVFMPFFFLNEFAKLALVSTYAAVGWLMVLGVIFGLIWFGMRYEAICRVWRRRMR